MFYTSFFLFLKMLIFKKLTFFNFLKVHISKMHTEILTKTACWGGVVVG